MRKGDVVKLGLLGALPFVGYFAYRAYCHTRIERHRAALSAEGYGPAEPESLPVRTAEPNALVFYRRTKVDAPETEGGAPCYFWERAAETEEYVASCAHLFPLIERGLAARQFRWELGRGGGMHDWFDDLRSCILAARLLTAKASLRAAAGHPDEAFATCIQALRLCAQVPVIPSSLAWFFRHELDCEAIVATDYLLRRYPVSDRTLREIGGHLSDSAIPSFAATIAARRAALIDGRMGKKLYRWEVLWNLNFLLETQQQAALPFSEYKTWRESTITNEWKELDAMYDDRDYFQKALVLRRCLAIVIACKRNELAGGSSQPTLAELHLPEETKTDPFNGRRLVLRHADDGPIVYSVGRDLVDNGGTFRSTISADLDIGLAPDEMIFWRNDPCY